MDMLATRNSAAGAWYVGDIFREIDEELRQERFEKLWRRYGKYVIAAAVAVVLAVAGFQAWNYHITNKREAESARFSMALSLMRDGRSDDAAALFASLAEDAGAGYAPLARFNQAALRARSGDLAGAADIFDALAADRGIGDGMRGAATIYGALYRMEAGQGDRDALRARLEPLLGSGGPFRHSAAELSALLALDAGDTAAARTLIAGIVDDAEAPPRIRGRATELLAVIGE
jgi:hypothetical protein